MCAPGQGACRKDRCSIGTFGGRISCLRIEYCSLEEAWRIPEIAHRQTRRGVPSALWVSILQVDCQLCDFESG